MRKSPRTQVDKFGRIVYDARPGGNMKQPEWIFDLDGTLYASQNDVWGRLFPRIVRYFSKKICKTEAEVSAECDVLKLKHGTHQTIVAFMREYEIEFNEYGLDFDMIVHYVYDGIFSGLCVEPRLGLETIANLPGRKWVLSNSPETFVHDMLVHLGVRDVFNGIFGVRSDALYAKPEARSYDRVPVESDRIIFVDDGDINLHMPAYYGWGTVWFPEDETLELQPNQTHVHKRIHSLSELSTIIS